MPENEVSQQAQEPQFAAFVGIDWADQKHAWCLQVTGSRQRESGELEHKVETVEAWVAQLCQRFGERPIAIAVEQVKGALVYMLAKYKCLHLYPVPPAMTANLRKAFYSSGAKNDPSGMPIYCWICRRGIGKSCAACRRIRRLRGASRIWWRSGASWLTRRRPRVIV